MVLGFLRPADQDRAVAVEPGVGAFDDPAAGAEAGLTGQLLLFFATRADVRGEAELVGEFAHLAVVVGRVEAQTLRTLSGRPGPLDRDRLERRPGKQMIVAVGALVGYPDRDAATLGEERSLRPFLALSVGFGPVCPPPSGALLIAPSIASHSHSIPVRLS